MPRVLVLFAHPALERSRVNRRLAEAVTGLPDVTVHDLYEAYPDFDVDVEREQALLVAHDVLVVQHPFYWYSTPALVKQWEDLVLEHGWAYGSGGTALHGKLWVQAVTTGGRDTAYRTDGHNRFTMRQLLAPLEQTARLCGMTFLAPFVVHGTHLMTPQDIAAHASAYRRLVEALRAGTLDVPAAQRAARLDPGLDGFVSPMDVRHGG
jgi:glutathione-regulated potassium-efflux system ancillary protein KefG